VGKGGVEKIEKEKPEVKVGKLMRLEKIPKVFPRSLRVGSSAAIEMEAGLAAEGEKANKRELQRRHKKSR